MPTEGKVFEVDLGGPMRTEFQTEGKVSLEPTVPVPAPGLVAARADDHLSIERYSRAVLDQIDPEKVHVAARIAPNLPVYYKDIEPVPEIAKALAKGGIEGATLGAVRMPELKDETTPMHIARIA